MIDEFLQLKGAKETNWIETARNALFLSMGEMARRQSAFENAETSRGCHGL
jgi:hypothetical protein